MSTSQKILTMNCKAPDIVCLKNFITLCIDYVKRFCLFPRDEKISPQDPIFYPTYDAKISPQDGLLTTPEQPLYNPFLGL